MNAETFQRWFDEMKLAGLLRTKKEAAQMLGVTPDTITAYFVGGCSMTVALACRALYHRMEPFQ